MILKNRFDLQHVKQAWHVFIVSHGTSMGQQMINGKKLHIFPFMLRGDINMELIQDKRLTSSRKFTFILNMH
jgi:hypothetical protein